MVEIEHVIHASPEMEEFPSFTSFINKKPEIFEYYTYLKEFLREYYKTETIKPLKIQFRMFVFFGEDYMEPMVKIWYRGSEVDDILVMGDHVEGSFRESLARRSLNVDEFKKYMDIQKDFRFVFIRV